MNEKLHRSPGRRRSFPTVWLINFFICAAGVVGAAMIGVFLAVTGINRSGGPSESVYTVLTFGLNFPLGYWIDAGSLKSDWEYSVWGINLVVTAATLSLVWSILWCGVFRSGPEIG